MHTDSGMTGISLSGYMPYMTVASLEMSDEPKRKPRCRHLQRGFCLKAETLFLRTKRYYSIGTLKGTAGKPAAL